MNALALPLTPSISSNELFFNKGFVVEGEREVLKERIKTNRGRGGEVCYLYAHSVKKHYLIFQTVVVAESFFKMK